MKRLFFTAALLISVAYAQGWKFDSYHSFVTFAVDHNVVSEASGKFKKFNVAVEGQKDDLSDLKINATIDVASIDTDNENRDGHLKGEDFFDAAKYPTATFVSTGIKKTGKNSYDIPGNLTLRGVTKPVVLKATSKGVVKAGDKTVTGLRAEATINRKDFGVSWSKTLDAGGLVVGDEVRIAILAELTK